MLYPIHFIFLLRAADERSIELCEEKTFHFLIPIVALQFIAAEIFIIFSRAPPLLALSIPILSLCPSVPFSFALTASLLCLLPSLFCSLSRFLVLSFPCVSISLHRFPSLYLSSHCISSLLLFLPSLLFRSAVSLAFHLSCKLR